MIHRLTLSALFVFWALMMFLLWKAEFGRELKGSLPPEVVVQRIITAPDESSMIIYRRGERIGTMRWSANVGETLANARLSPMETAPQGQVTQVSEYTLDGEGSVYPGENAKPFKYDFRLILSTNKNWREIIIRLSQRPDAWTFRANAEKAEITLTHTADGDSWDKVIPFEDLRRPEKLLAEFGMPWASALIGSSLGLSPQQASVEQISLGLKWEASLGFVPLGKSSVRSYRLSAKLFDRFEVAIFVSRLGELLRVELPDGYVLINERWTML